MNVQFVTLLTLIFSRFFTSSMSIFVADYNIISIQDESYVKHFTITNDITNEEKIEKKQDVIHIQEAKNVNLTDKNTIILRGPVNHDSVSNVILEINKKPNKGDIFLYLNTNGGDVESGLKLVTEIEKYNISCIADKAYSMGFMIFQVCNKRYILPHGRIMQHQISFGIQDEFGKIKNYVDFVEQMGNTMIRKMAQRINIDQSVFYDKVRDDWWLMGENAVIEHCADQVVNVFCSTSLTNANYTIQDNYNTYIYSKCPLIEKEIEKIGKKTNDFFFFM